MNLLFKLIQSKWVFTKPKRKKILIYDNASIKTAEFIFNKSEYEVLSIRYESLNFYTFFLTIIKNGFKNIKNNYKINFIKLTSPEIIFSAFTYNPAFFKLKNFYPKALYICYAFSSCDERFFLACKKHYENENLKLKSDYLFIVGDYYQKKFQKYIDTKVVNIGSLKNNLYKLENLLNEKRNNIMLFISQVYAFNDNQIVPKYKKKIDNEIRIVRSLEKYCKKNNYQLKIATRNKRNADKFYKKKFGEGNWVVYPRIKESTSYNLVNESSIIIFTNSFLGLEALSKGKRCIAFPPEEFPIQRFGKKFSSEGPFWSQSFSDEILEKYIKNIQKYDDKSWKKVVDENIGDLIKYDPNNKTLKGTLKNLNIENILN